MDNSSTNNPFNNPITGADQNDDFFTEAPKQPVTPDMGKIQPEFLGGGEQDSAKPHRLRLGEKAREVVGRRREHVAHQMHDARELQRARKELANGSRTKEEVDKALSEATRTVRAFARLAEFADKFKELGGNETFKEVAPLVAGFALTLLPLMSDQKGLAGLVINYGPDLLKGLYMGWEKKPVSKVFETRGRETTGWTRASDHVVGGALGAVANYGLGEIFSNPWIQQLVGAGDDMFAGVKMMFKRNSEGGNKHQPSKDTVETPQSPTKESTTV